MQAMVLHRIGQPLEFETLANPEPVAMRSDCASARVGFAALISMSWTANCRMSGRRLFLGMKSSDASIMGC
jgi:hypothetical protein